MADSTCWTWALSTAWWTGWCDGKKAGSVWQTVGGWWVQSCSPIAGSRYDTADEAKAALQRDFEDKMIAGAEKLLGAMP